MTIRETVRNAQDTLARFRKPEPVVACGGVWIPYPFGGTDRDKLEWEKFMAFFANADGPRVQYQQSLGELCLQSYADALLHWTMHETRKAVPSAVYRGEVLDLTISNEDCNALRRALYHRSRP